MPERREKEQWEPSEALTSALEEASLLPGAPLDGDLAGLKRHLSETEKIQAEALRMLLASIERAQR